MVGARIGEKAFDYPDHGTTSPREAYAGCPHWQPGTPPLQQLFPPSGARLQSGSGDLS
jgi:hypothetical protein